MPKTYDRAYFDKWYRNDEHRVISRDVLARKVAMAVAMAEYYLGRPIRNVLDVGCGEGAWHAPLHALRPHAHYLGLDPSEYAISRWGRTRNLRLATFAQLEHLRFDERFDLIVCADVLHYLRAPEVRRGLPASSTSSKAWPISRSIRRATNSSATSKASSAARRAGIGRRLLRRG